MKLVGTIQPFSGMQSIHLYNDENKEIEYRLAYLHSYSATIVNFLNDYPDISKLDLHGNEQFCTKIKSEIEADLLSKYNYKERIEVNII